jgi:hypothetical protein
LGKVPKLTKIYASSLEARARAVLRSEEFGTAVLNSSQTA